MEIRKKIIITAVVLAVSGIIGFLIYMDYKETVKPKGKETMFSFNTDTLELTYNGNTKVFKNSERNDIFDIIQKLDYEGGGIELGEIEKNSYIKMDFKNGKMAFVVKDTDKIYIVGGDKVIENAKLNSAQIEFLKGYFD